MKTIRQEIFSDEQLNKFLIKLDNLPDRVQAASDALAAAEYEAAGIPLMLKDIEGKIADIEREAMFEVINETNDDGKKAYTNQEQRAAAQAQFLSKSDDYLDAKNDLLKAKQKKAEVENHVAKCKNQMWGIKNQFDVALAVAGIIAGLSHESTAAGKLELIERIKATL